ncbi:serine/threonine-protein kinase 19 isoform X3 [Helianthus annuus]|uniref:serine/threonine-protein kinase 19 isoform X3 n=1 Tax=Helianthus annuus TaxID=4232 RepID=UPI000B8F81B8|nr:serine/threonine-protein kinase 19 isoform X3 [Helianthus annuus]
METSNNNPSTSRKRSRSEDNSAPESNQSHSLEDNLIFSDTMVALQMMRAQFPRIDKSLRREKVLRVFKLNTGQDDHALMFMEDYLKQMKRAVKSMETKKQGVFEWFEVHVIHSKPEPCIGHQELLSLLSLGGKVKDEDISLLINAGLLTRQLIDSEMYWFAIPNIGSVLKGLTQGRKELLSLLNRKKYKEMMLAILEKKRLRLSPLDIRFHLRDLLGSGHLKTIQTPSGLVIRVVKN